MTDDLAQIQHRHAALADVDFNDLDADAVELARVAHADRGVLLGMLRPAAVPLTSYAAALEAIARQEGCGEDTRTRLRAAARLVRGAAGEPAGPSAPSEEIERLTRERDELLTEARAATNQISDLRDEAEGIATTNKRHVAEIERLNGLVETLHKRLDIRTQERDHALSAAMLPLVREARAFAERAVAQGIDDERRALRAEVEQLQGAFAAVGFPRQDGEPLTDTFARAWQWCVDMAHVAQTQADEARASKAPLSEEEAERWAEKIERKWWPDRTASGLQNTIARAVYDASRGDIPPEVRPAHVEPDHARATDLRQIDGYITISLPCREDMSGYPGPDGGTWTDARGEGVFVFRDFRSLSVKNDDIVKALLAAWPHGGIPADVRPPHPPVDAPTLTDDERDLVIAAIPLQSGLTRDAQAIGVPVPVDATDAPHPPMTREEALRRLDALSPSASRHLDTAADWLAAYEASAQRDPERDEMADVLRGYLAGPDAPSLFDAPRDALDAVSARLRGPDPLAEAYARIAAMPQDKRHEAMRRVFRSWSAPSMCLRYEGCRLHTTPRLEIEWPDGERWPVSQEARLPVDVLAPKHE